ncbi:MAG: reverse transcriptase-like protein [Planctomycetota bacterium]|nr:MAG: reverse transcriptase-like protein [Planctomycetota bacterium]
MVVHIDGGSRGNPGPAGAGVVIRRESGDLLHEGAYFLGHQTNNAAEYHGLIRALQRAEPFATEPLTILSDSQLLVRQLTGEYRVKSPALYPLFEQAQMLLLRFSVWKVKHIPREQNRRADELANLAMDRGNDVIVFDVDADGNPVDSPATRDPAPTESPRGGGDCAEPASSAEATTRRARVAIARPPDEGQCPADDWAADSFCVGATFPRDVCVHAAHALLPTILAILNAEPSEFSAIPTMTVRCTRRGCDAQFEVGPERFGNGKSTAK